MLSFDFALSPAFVKYYCIGIGAFLAVSVLLLVRQLGPLWFKLRQVTGDLESLDGEEGFARGFEGYDRKVKEAFGLAWTEFVETLILPAKSEDPIRNTSEVSRYLNDATIVFPRISSGFFQAVPNLLTGFGILGTFLGLAAGVGAAKSGLSSEDARHITGALQQLLGGASLAFWTSIVGIGCSIFFVFVERFASRRLHIALDKWVGAIESRVERVTSEGVALDHLDQARRTTTQLERFNTDLIFALEQALEEKIAGRLSPQLEQLLQAVERLREDRATDSGQMIEQALVRFTDALQERAGSQFEDMAATVDDLNRTLKESAGALAETQQTVQTAMDSGASAMTQTLRQSLDEVTRSLADASEQLANQLTASGKEAAAELQSTVSSATQKLAETGVSAAAQIAGSLGGLQGAAENLELASMQTEKMLSGMNQFVERLNALRGTIESTHEQIAGVAEPMERAARGMQDSADRTAGTLTQTSDLVGRVEASITTLEGHQQQVATAWTEYQRRFEGIDNSLVEVFRQFDEGLSRYCAQVQQFANELDKTTSHTVQQLASATAELSGAIEDLLPRLPGSPR